MAEDWLHGTTGVPPEAAAALRARRFLHVTVLMTPELAQVGATAPVVGDPLPLDRGALRVGRELLADRSVSRQQGVIRPTAGGGAEVVDLGSRFGTWLNGRRLAADTPTPVHEGDRLLVGQSLLYFHRLPHDPGGWERDTALRRAAGQRRDRESLASERRAIGEVHDHLVNDGLVGTTFALREARREVLAAARLDGPVLVTGPTGSGKEAVAAAIHTASMRRRAPFVAFSCAEVAPNLVVAELFGAVKGAYTGADRDRPGLWRSAAHGTMFLDEIGDAPAELQAALLRAIESGTIRPVGATQPVSVDVRIVAATKRDLDAEVASGGFRDDLLYRLMGTHVALTSLADRPADAILLFAAGLRRHGLTRVQAGRDLLDALWDHAWPGNGREVMHLAERVRADAAPDGAIVLPADFVPTSSLRRATPAPRPDGKPTPPRDAAELRAVLLEHDGNVTSVATAYGVRRQQVYRWLTRYDVDLNTLRG